MRPIAPIPPSPSASFSWRLVLLTTAVLLLPIVPFLLFGERADAWTANLIERGRDHPWAAGTLLALLLAIDVLAPIPSSLVSTACGSLLGFRAGTLASFLGMTGSAVLGYALGRGASAFIRKRLHPGELATLNRLHGDLGLWMLAAVRPVPVLAEASLIFLGLARLPWKRALPILLLANLAVSAVYAALGASATRHDATGLAFLAAALLSGAALLAFHRASKRHSQ